MRFHPPVLLFTLAFFGLFAPNLGTRVSAQGTSGEAPSAAVVTGAWETSYDVEGRAAKLVMIISPTHLSMASYYADNGEFIATIGGGWRADWTNFLLTYEYDSANPEQVGSVASMPYEINDDFLVFNGSKFWRRIDDNSDGALPGAWEIIGRRADGKMRDLSSRRDGPRKTMKILSGTRFQWVAFNTETGEFSGTGGGTYTTNAAGKYVESIEFFSRDAKRVGQILSFDYALEDGDWVHRGKSSKGADLHEVWSLRVQQ